MSLKDKEKWNSKYGGSECLAGRQPCSWLADNRTQLPGKGRALDLAMGEGRNALFAASLGYDVLGVDISEVGVQRANELAQERGLSLKGEVADLDDWTILENTFDLVMCFYFLDRKLFEPIRKSLRPGGLVIFETFNQDHLKYTDFKPEWVLDHNELIKEFYNYRILHYRETDEDEKGASSILARKPEENDPS